MILLVLRFGPKFYLQDDSESEIDEEEEVEEVENLVESKRNMARERWLQQQGGSTTTLQTKGEEEQEAPSLSESLRSQQRESRLFKLGFLNP